MAMVGFGFPTRKYTVHLKSKKSFALVCSWSFLSLSSLIHWNHIHISMASHDFGYGYFSTVILSFASWTFNIPSTCPHTVYLYVLQAMFSMFFHSFHFIFLLIFHFYFSQRLARQCDRRGHGKRTKHKTSSGLIPVFFLLVDIHIWWNCICGRRS